MDLLIRNYIENAALMHGDRMMMDSRQVFEGSVPWVKFQQWAMFADFDLVANGAWELLGVAKYEGPAPDKMSATHRANILLDMLTAVGESSLDPEEQADRARMVCQVPKALQKVLDELKEVLETRKKCKSSKDRLPKWGEASNEVLKLVMGTVTTPGVCMLRTSNVLRSVPMELGQGHQLATTVVARDFVGKLLKGGGDTVEALSEIDGSGVTLWCPESREDLGRLCAGIMKAAGTKIRATVTIVIPLEPRPGCHRPEAILDTWSHELLSNKWLPIIDDVRFSSEPVKVVVSGRFAPMHQVKSLCLVSLCTFQGRGTKGMMVSRGVLNGGMGPGMIVADIQEEDEVNFLRLAHKITSDVVLEWHGPARAASTTKEAKRLIYVGNIACRGALEARASLLQVKVQMQELDVILGLHSTYGNEETVIVDVSSPAAALKVLNLTEDAVMVSPRLMLARSSASELQWQESVNRIFEDNDNDYVDKVRYRPSGGGGVIAAAPALKEQRELKKFQAKGSDGRELQVVIRLGGELIQGRARELEQFVAKIAECSRIPLAESHTEVLKAPYQWSMMSDARYGWRGDILIKLATKAEVILLYRSVEGKSIAVADGGQISIEVLPHVTLVDELRNGGAAGS